MKIAILCIITKDYLKYWSDFYNSSKVNFLPDNSKHYFIFTDDVSYFNELSDITVINIDSDTRNNINYNRFKYFTSIDGILREYDYCYFFNINIIFDNKVDDNIIPDEKNNYIVTTFYNDVPKSYHKRVLFSKVRIFKPKFYSRGCLIGGRINEFLSICYNCIRLENEIFKNTPRKITDEDYFNYSVKDMNPLNYLITGFNTGEITGIRLMRK